MNAPKILPWIARRAGIDDQHALRLWNRAVAESEKTHDQKDGATYHAEVMTRLIDSMPASA